jgi:hypothetical protein
VLFQEGIRLLGAPSPAAALIRAGSRKDIFAAGIFLKPIETKASVVDAGLGAAI